MPCNVLRVERVCVCSVFIGVGPRAFRKDQQMYLRSVGKERPPPNRAAVLALEVAVRTGALLRSASGRARQNSVLVQRPRWRRHYS